MTATEPRTGVLSYNRACNVEDFSHPDLRAVLREVFAHELVRFGRDYPTGREDRKEWEVAMAVRTFRDHGLLDGSSRLLGIGAGNDPTVFHLTRRARRVFATDLYLDPERRDGRTDPSMLAEPERNWPFAWNPRRLVVQHMDPLDLRYDDASMDGVFSRTIGHAGEDETMMRALDEVYRVLRPGGVLSVATDVRVDGNACDAAAVFRDLVGSRDWLPVSPVELDVSEATLATADDAGRHVDDLSRQVRAQGGYFTFKLAFERYPQLVLRWDGACWTRVHLALRKAEGVPGSAPAPAPPAADRMPAPPELMRRRPLGHSKVCNVEDFAHPQLRSVVRALPVGERRRSWETAMTMRSFAHGGVLDSHSELLGIGAGHQAAAFALTRHAGRVFATDHYLPDDAGASMLTEPERHWPYAWEPRRLVVQHMDPLDLRYEDNSLDGVFSLQSLERQAEFDDVRRCVSEMHRVLRPGGVLALSTTFSVSGPAPGRPGGWMFTVPLIYDLLFGESAWEIPEPIDFAVSPATLSYGHDLVKRVGDHVCTSLHVTLRKP